MSLSALSGDPSGVWLLPPTGLTAWAGSRHPLRPSRLSTPAQTTRYSWTELKRCQARGQCEQTEDSFRIWENVITQAGASCQTRTWRLTFSAPKESKQLALGVPGARGTRQSKHSAAGTAARNPRPSTESGKHSQYKLQTAPTLQKRVHGISPSGPALGPKQIKISFLRKWKSILKLWLDWWLWYLLSNSQHSAKEGCVYTADILRFTNTITCAFWRSLDLVPLVQYHFPLLPSPSLAGSSPGDPEEFFSSSN